MLEENVRMSRIQNVAAQKVDELVQLLWLVAVKHGRKSGGRMHRRRW